MRRLSAMLVLAALWCFPCPGATWAQTAEPGADLAPEEEPEPQLETPPKLKELVGAELPDGTVFPADEVVVVLEIEVGADGGVSSVEVLQGPGEPFDGAAAAAAKRFSFEPGRLDNGEAVPVTVTFRMRITRPVVEAPPPPEPIVLRGRLLERGTRKPLKGVAVVAKSGDDVLARTSSEADGSFEIESPEASFRLVAVPAAHDRLDVEVEAEPGEERSVTYYLERALGAHETVVRATKVRREVTRRVVRRSTILNAAGTTGDALKVIQNLPGASRTPFSGGPLIMRGASPGDSKAFIEGHQIPQTYHFGGLRSTFNSAFLESIDFVPGNFATDFGRATGGIVDIRVRDPDPEGFHGEVEANLYDAGFVVEGPLSERWSVGAAFHRSYVDVVLDAVIPEDSPISFDVAPRYYDYQFLATRRGEGGNKLKLMFYGSLDKLRFLIDEPAADPKIRGNLDTRVMFHNLHAGYSSQLAEGLRQETSIVPGLQQVRVQMGPDIFFEMFTYRVSLRSAWTLELARWVDLRAGVDARVDQVHVKVNASQPPKEGENPVPFSTMEKFAIDKKVTAFNAGLFSELRLRPVKGLLVLPSVRADRHDPLDRFTVDPRLAVRYRGWPNTVFKLGFGLYSKQPQVDETDEDFGTPELLGERALQLSGGIEQGLFDLMELDVVLFYKWLDRVVTRNDERAVNPEAPSYTNEGTGRILGVEVLLKLLEGQRLSGWVAYTFQRSFRTDGPGKEERLFDFDQPHILTVLGSYLLGRGWSVGLRYRLVSGNPSTPIVGSIHDAMSDTYVPVWGENNSERMGTFHQLDARVDKTWTFDTWRLQLYLDVQNVTNRGNPEGWEYNFDFTERNVITGLPILPVLGLKGSW